MAELKIKVFPAGPLSANNYLIFDKESKKAFIVDLSDSSGELFLFLKNEKIEVEFVALTHGHFDHIEGLRQRDFPFYLHPKDEELFLDPNKNGSAFFFDFKKIDKKPFYYKDVITFSGRQIEVLHTPGHTPGSVSLKLGNWLFTGDTLFRESIGRTDIPLASSELILESIQTMLSILPQDCIVYPGHGPSSTLEHEKRNNPFLREP